jgi:hypothetical protein
VRTWFDDAGHRRISHWSCSRSTSTACRRFGPYSRWQLLTGGFAPPLWRDHRHGKRSQGHPSGDVATFLKKPVDPFVVATAVDEAVRRLRWGTLTRTIPLADRRSFRGVPTVLGASAPRPVDFERLFRGELLGVGTQQVQKATKRRPLMTPDVVFLAIFATSLSSIYLRREISNSMCFRCEGSSPHQPVLFPPSDAIYPKILGTYWRRKESSRTPAEGISLEAAGTIPDAVWRKVRCFADPAASTMSPRTGRFLGVSRGLLRTGSVVASDGTTTTCDHNSHAVS